MLAGIPQNSRRERCPLGLAPPSLRCSRKLTAGLSPPWTNHSGGARCRSQRNPFPDRSGGWPASASCCGPTYTARIIRPFHQIGDANARVCSERIMTVRVPAPPPLDGTIRSSAWEPCSRLVALERPLLVGKRSPVEAVNNRNVVDRLDRLHDAPEIGATAAMVVHGGVGAEKRRRCERVTLGAGGRIQRPGGRTPVRFGHWVHEHLAWARGAHRHAIGRYQRTLRDGLS